MLDPVPDTGRVGSCRAGLEEAAGRETVGCTGVAVVGLETAGCAGAETTGLEAVGCAGADDEVLEAAAGAGRSGREGAEEFPWMTAVASR